MRTLLVEDFIDFQRFNLVPIRNGNVAGIGTEPHWLNLLVFANYTVTPRARTQPGTVSELPTDSPPTESDDDVSSAVVASTLVMSATVEVVPLVSVPLGLVVIPLTLLSVYLILWKRRERGTS